MEFNPPETNTAAEDACDNAAPKTETTYVNEDGAAETETPNSATFIVSLAKNVDDKHARVNASPELATVVQYIRTGRYNNTAVEVLDFPPLQPMTNKIQARFADVLKRSGGNRKAAKGAVETWKKGLPVMLPCGDFSKQANECLIIASGLVAVDYDALGNRVQEVREKLQASPHCVLCQTSPSGDGVKALLRVPPARNNEDHLARYYTACEHATDLTGIDPRIEDDSGKDIARRYFLCFDPSVYFNPNTFEMDLLPLPEEQPAQVKQKERREKPDKEQVREMLSYIPKRPDYPIWVKIISAVGDALSDDDDALEVLIEWSKEEKPGEYRDKLHNPLKGVTVGALFYLAKEHGWTRKKPAREPLLPPRVVNLVNLQPATIDDPNTLLGNRFLCRGGGGELVGSTGIGKSTLLMQCAMHWAIGRECFGIKPNGALKVLMVQAENDEGDLCEMRDGALESLGEITDEEQKLLAKNFVCVFESCRTGQELIDAIAILLPEHSPDLLCLDPANAYIGGNSGAQEIVGPFLRNMLNPLLQQHECGAIIVHHTNKPRAEGNGQKVATDVAYSGAGSAEWANWARFVLNLSFKNDDGMCEFRIGKRFRLGWKDPSGNPTKVKFLKQNVEGGSLFFTELSSNEAAMVSSKTSPVDKVLWSALLPDEGESIEKTELIARIMDAKPKICGRDAARHQVLPLLIGDGYLKETFVSRRRGPAEVRLERTAKRPVHEYDAKTGTHKFTVEVKG